MASSTRRSGQTLIGLIVVVAIIIAVAGIYLSAKGRNPDGSESTKTALRQSIDRSQEVALQSNLGQIEQIIGMYRSDNDGKPPASFDELKSYAKFPAEMWINPVDKQPLDYDPATGMMIVPPYEGMSPSLQRYLAGQGQRGGGAPSTPDTGGAPVMPQIPTIPNSGNVPLGDDQ